jgi:hypothetical protein
LGLRESEVTKKQGKLFAVYVKMRGKTRIWAKIISVRLLDKTSKETDYHIINHFTPKQAEQGYRVLMEAVVH